ncbi:MAG: ROK family protein [Oscillospiraceae bacterium]|jgi:glucokinase|nr:ROK family protein [Oscillospiraceae bacterium]
MGIENAIRCITPKEMRDINRTCILEYLRQHGAVSRSMIASDLGLSLSSVVRITDDLTEDRLVHLQGAYETSGGRRRPLIELDTQQNVVISITLGGTHATACLCDITGAILERHTVQNHGMRGIACVDLLKSLADEMLGKVAARTVRGISVGVPGIVIGGNRVIAAPAVGLDNVLLADMLTPYYPYPVFVENDVNLAALGELWFGYGKQCNDLLYIHIGTLVGMGIVLGRCILHGAHTGAGELGYAVLDAEHLKYPFESMGALEERISGFGMGNRTRAALSANGTPNADATAADLFRCAESGEHWAQEILQDFLDKMAMVMINLAALFDPEIIVLGGGVMESAQAYIPRVASMIRGKTPNPIHVLHSKLGKNARILGGCTSVLQHTNHYTIHKSML